MYWAAMMQANVWVGLMAFLGLVVSSTFAWGMRLNTGFLHSGLYGFSGFLTAATMAYFNGAGKPVGPVAVFSPHVCGLLPQSTPDPGAFRGRHR